MIPPILYKYLVPDRFGDVLIERKIRFTQACFLNDPFEFNPGSTPESAARFQKWVGRRRSDTYREKASRDGVFCLTEDNKSIPMWTHYAAGHTGFVIGFDTSSDLFTSAAKSGKLNRVKYSERVNVTEGLANPDAIFWTKSKEWEYEREWRWIESCRPDGYDEVRAGPGGELFYLRSIPPQSIKELILGCRAKPVLADSVRAIRSTPDYRHLKLFAVTPDKTEYALAAGPLAP